MQRPGHCSHSLSLLIAYVSKEGRCDSYSQTEIQTEEFDPQRGPSNKHHVLDSMGRTFSTSGGVHLENFSYMEMRKIHERQQTGELSI